GGRDLVAGAQVEDGGNQGHFDLVEDALIDAGGGQIGLVFAEKLGQFAFDHGYDIGAAAGFGGKAGAVGEVEFVLDDFERDHLVGIERGEATDEIFEFADVPRPV